MSLPHEGRVQWFDKSSGEGVIVGDDGISYYVHYSTILPEYARGDGIRRDLNAGRRVRFSLYVNLYSARVEQCEEVANANAA